MWKNRDRVFLMPRERMESQPPHETLGLRVQLARLALQTTPLEEMKYPPIDNVKYFDVHKGDTEGPVIGTFNIQYFPTVGARVLDVFLEQEERRKGFGVEMYRAVPFLPLPFRGGGSFRERKLRFMSGERDSDHAINVWRSLEKQRFAHKIGNRAYVMDRKIPKPAVLDIREFRL